MQYHFLTPDQPDNLQTLLQLDPTAFQRPHKQIPNFGYTDRVLWLRWNVSNSDAQPHHWWLDMKMALISSLTLYQPDGDGGYKQTRIGTEFPYDQRALAREQLAFKIVSPAHSLQTLYLRLESQYSMRLPAVIVTDQEQWYQTHQFHERFYSLLFGVLLAQGLYNLLLFFSLRDSMYLSYVGFVFTCALNQMLFWGYLAPWLPAALLPWMNAIVHSCIAVVTFFGLLFAYQFLGLAQQRGWQCWAPRILLALLASLAITPFIAPTARIAPLINLCVSVTVLVAISVCLMQALKSRGARFLLLAWLGLLAGGLTEQLRNAGLLPINALTHLMYPLGLMLDSLLLSLALADRIRWLRQEKEAAQQKLTDTLIIARDELEERVARRTRELSITYQAAEEAIAVKNHFLQLVSHDLRSPLTSLQMLLSLLESEPEKGRSLLTHSGPLLDQIVERIDRLSHIRQIDSSQHWKLDLHPLCLHSLVQQRLDHQSTQAGLQNISLHNQVTEHSIIVADPHMLADVLDNLISNAIRFSKHGQSVEITGPGKDYTLAVSDHGPGLNTDTAAQLFQGPVDSQPGVRGDKGQGHGLLFCHQVMQAHGGRLWYTEGRTQGSCFRLLLPDQPETTTAHTSTQQDSTDAAIDSVAVKKRLTS
ncbi:MAG: sensor histidine kinase [Marinobacterium sp.]|nr:sensor histidine kinase [Marinobacterium sp.]